MPDALYVVTNLATALVTVVIGLQIVSPPAIGFAQWARGLRWGGAVVLFTLALFGLALVLPGFRDLFHDARVDGGLTHMLYETLVRIPLGTVVLEEVAFRGVLPAVLAARPWSAEGLARGGANVRTLQGVVGASVLFGVWHVLPSLHLSKVNPVAERLLGDGLAGQVVGVAFAVLGTFLAGLWLCFLRYRSGSITGSMLAHLSSNSLGFAIAWVVTGGGIHATIGTALSR